MDQTKLARKVPQGYFERNLLIHVYDSNLLLPESAPLTH